MADKKQNTTDVWVAPLVIGMMMAGSGAVHSDKTVWISIGLPVIGLFMILASVLFAVRELQTNKHDHS